MGNPRGCCVCCSLLSGVTEARCRYKQRTACSFYRQVVSYIPWLTTLECTQQYRVETTNIAPHRPMLEATKLRLRNSQNIQKLDSQKLDSQKLDSQKLDQETVKGNSYPTYSRFAIKAHMHPSHLSASWLLRISNPLEKARAQFTHSTWPPFPSSHRAPWRPTCSSTRTEYSKQGPYLPRRTDRAATTTTSLQFVTLVDTRTRDRGYDSTTYDMSSECILR